MSGKHNLNVEQVIVSLLSVLYHLFIWFKLIDMFW